MIYPYEATTYIDKGWWLVHAVDIGRQTRVSTLAETEHAARQLYAQHLRKPFADVEVRLHMYRATPTSIIRSRWAARNS